MSITLKLTDGITTVDLINGPFMLADSGWEVESPNGEPVWDTITCLVRGSSNDIRQEQSRIDILARQADRYVTDINENRAVYLIIAGSGESPKQVVVLSIVTKYHSDSNMNPLLGENIEDGDTLQMVTLGILRTPYFEPDLSQIGYAAYAAGNVSDLGGKWQIGGGDGVADQRIAKFTISDDSVPSYEHNKFWVGIRRLRYGVTDFNPVWEAELATSLTDANGGADATASGGFSVTVNFATQAGLAERLRFLVTEFTSGLPTHMIGNYLVLGRVKLSTGTTEVHVQLKEGHMAYGNITSVSGDTYLSAITNPDLVNWNLVELGYVQIPSTGNRESITSDQNGVGWYGLSLLAERISVSGSVFIDCLVLIPTDHYFAASDCKVGGALDILTVITSNLNEQIAIGETPNQGPLGGFMHYSVNFAMHNWSYPSDGGILVVAGQKKAQHDLNKSVDLSINLCPRWPIFRV